MELSLVFPQTELQGVYPANAEKLFNFLVGSNNTKFADWIKNRIDQYDFIEGQDYVTETVSTAGRPRKEYFITLDMAKELCMVENNDKGKEARRYFIEVERAFISSEQSRLSKLEERIAEQNALISEQKDAIYAERAKVSELDWELKYKIIRIANLEKKLPVIPPKVTELEEKIRKLEKELEDKRYRALNHLGEEATLRGQIMTLVEKISEKNKELEHYRDTTNSFRESNASKALFYKQKISEIGEVVAAINKETAALMDSISKARVEIEQNMPWIPPRLQEQASDKKEYYK